MYTNFFKLFAIVSLTCCSLYAQDILWEKSYGGKHAEYLFDAQPTADYGFILAGSSLSGKTGSKSDVNFGDLDYWVWKMDETGQPDWQKSMGGTGADMLYSIRTTRDGGFILAGSSDSEPGEQKKDACRGKEDFWIVKLNAKGSEEWQRTLGGAGQDIVKSIVPTADGGYIIGGSSSSGISLPILKGGIDKYGKSEACRGNLDYWVVKLDEKGEVQWQKTLGGQYADILESIEQTADTGYIIGGYSNSPSSKDKAHEGYGAGDFWVVKLDKDGVTEWQTTLGGENDDHLNSITQTKDGGFLAGGNSASASSGNKRKSNRKGTDMWLVKLDAKGEILWDETYNSGDVDILTSLVENNDGAILIGGYAQSEVIGTTKKDKKEINDYIALKVSADGEEIWKRTVGSSGEDILRKLIETRDGGYLLAGTSKGDISRDKNTNKGSNDFWVVKLKDKQKKEVPKKKTQLEAIPNPGVDFTNIIVGFDFDTGTATLFDLGGRALQSIEVNSRTIPLDIGSYPEGIYIVEVKTNKGTDSIKIMKSK